MCPIVVLGHPLEDAALDDAVLELVEGDLDVLTGEHLGLRFATQTTDEAHVVPVQPLDVVRIHGVLHDLEPVHRQRRVPDVTEHAVPHVEVVAR